MPGDVVIVGCGAPADLRVEPVALRWVVPTASAETEPAGVEVTEPASEPSDPAPRAPDGVLCVVRGSGRPRGGGCGLPLPVTGDLRGKEPVARVRPDQTSISWGIFRSGSRAWVHVKDQGISVAGFTDLEGETFSVRGEVPVLTGHMWLLDEAAVEIHHAKQDGAVLVSVKGDLIKGVDDLELPVACDALGYDPLPGRTVSVGGRGANAAPSGNELRLSIGPNERPFAKLGDGGQALSLPLEEGEALRWGVPRVCSQRADEALGGAVEVSRVDAERAVPHRLGEVGEARDDWTRVRLETAYARFDGWAPSASIDRQRGFGGRGRFGSICRLGRVLPPSDERAVVTEDSPLALGFGGQVRDASALRIAEGTEVVVASRRAGMVRVWIESAIEPPEGASFYGTESPLRPPN